MFMFIFRKLCVMKKSEMCWLNDMYKLFVEGLEKIKLLLCILILFMCICLNKKYVKMWK